MLYPLVLERKKERKKERARFLPPRAGNSLLAMLCGIFLAVRCN
jgi:hypothetical protein